MIRLALSGIVFVGMYVLGAWYWDLHQITMVTFDGGWTFSWNFALATVVAALAFCKMD